MANMKREISSNLGVTLTLVELPAADLQEGGDLGFSQQFKFAARRHRLRVHARGCYVNRRGGDTWRMGTVYVKQTVDNSLTQTNQNDGRDHFNGLLIRV
jgi:hypothetical protein